MSFNDFFQGLIGALFGFLSDFLNSLVSGALNDLLGINT